MKNVIYELIELLEGTKIVKQVGVQVKKEWQ